MNERETLALIGEIQKVDFREFWWGSPLLARAATARDSRVARALTFRHHSLSNKSAFSAHVIRQAIKLSDGPEFPSLWSFIDSENDPRAIVERMDDFAYLPWAATFVLGEVGGAYAFAATCERLAPSHQPRYHLLVRLLSHVVVRYLQIADAAEPTGTLIDVETGERKTVLLRDIGGDSYQMHLTKQTEADEYFTPLSIAAVADAKRRLNAIPDSVFNIPKPKFLHALDCLQTRNA
ncbi:MAG TPA: hypothetical protein VGM66_08965 [Candidatus Udaeobacter sp.]|jgi:hypothetical protein